MIHQERGNSIDLRQLIFPAVVVVAFSFFLFRLWMLQVVQAEELQTKVERLKSTMVEVEAPRGLIVDRQGRTLAGVRSEYIVTAIPQVMKKHPEVLEKLAFLTGATVDEINKNLSEGYWRPSIPVPVVNNITVAQATKLIEAKDLMGVDVLPQPSRFYSEPKMFSHILGYVRTPDKKDVERFQKMEKEVPDLVGKMGLEYSHDRDLSGDKGRLEVVMDGKNKPARVAEETPAMPGDKLVLGLDYDVQKAAYEALGDRNGAVVAIEPKTGVILCFVSAPTYDITKWLRGLSKPEYQALIDDERKPLLNRAVATPYMPGSTFKIVTTIAALIAGKFDPNRTVYCAHGLKIGKRMLRCTGFHSSVSFHRAFQSSCNAYFADLGLRAGPDALRKAAEMCGLGTKSGIDLRGERSGNVPTDEWMKRAYDRGWYPGDTANFAIGQGGITATPLELANMVSLVANRGKMYQPTFIRTVIHANGQQESVKPIEIHHSDAPDSFWDILQSAMASVMSAGTGKRGRINGLEWAGKTGSAENRRGSKTDSAFVGYAPLNDPKIAIAVVVENAGHGGEVAVPIAAKVIETYLFPPKPNQIPLGGANSEAKPSTSAALEGSPRAR